MTDLTNTTPVASIKALGCRILGILGWVPLGLLVAGLVVEALPAYFAAGAFALFCWLVEPTVRWLRERSTQFDG